MRYRAVATTVTGFVQQIACCYLRHGYRFYVTGCISKNKEPELIDQKLIRKYGIDISQSTRARRKRSGFANLQYMRYEQFFVILATKGVHHFFMDESKSIRDIQRVPLKFQGYSISYRRGGRTSVGKVDHKWHSHVSIERSRYLELKDYFVYLAKRRSVENLAMEFYRVPFEPYAPVRRQLLNILRAVNKVRKRAGLTQLPCEIIPMRRRIVKPFHMFQMKSNSNL